jgi:glycosyltransferase 2 family protein
MRRSLSDLVRRGAAGKAGQIEDPAKSDFPRTHRSRSRRDLIGWLLAITILAGLAIALDLQEVAATIARIDALDLVGILALLTFDRLLMAWKWSILLRAVRVRLPLTTITRFYYQGSLAGMMIPFMPGQVGGDLLRAYWVAEAHGATHPVFASLVMEKMIGFLSAIDWAIIGLVVFGCLMYGDRSLVWIALGTVAGLAVNGLFFLSTRSFVHNFILRGLRRWQELRILGLLARFYETYAGFSKAPRALQLNILLTVVEQGVQLIAMLLIARSLEIHVNGILFLAVAAIHMLIYRFPIAPDSWGVGELSAIALYGLIGVDPEAAFSLTFVGRLLSILVVLPGAWFLLRGSRPAPYRPGCVPTPEHPRLGKRSRPAAKLVSPNSPKEPRSH